MYAKHFSYTCLPRLTIRCRSQANAPPNAAKTPATNACKLTGDAACDLDSFTTAGRLLPASSYPYREMTKLDESGATEISAQP
jgi:hypothetical protein